MHTDLLQVFYILSLSEKEFEEYVSSIDSGVEKIFSEQNGREYFSSTEALLALFLHIYNKLFYDYDHLEDFILDLINDIFYLIENILEYNLFFTRSIFKESAKIVLSSLNTNHFYSEISFMDLLDKYGFTIIYSSYVDKMNDCKDFYPFDLLKSNYKIGCSALLNQEEKKYYGGFSEEISDIVERIFDFFILSLAECDESNYAEKLNICKFFKKKIDEIDKNFEKLNDYYLISYKSALEIHGLFSIIAYTSGIKEDDCFDLISDWYDRI